MKIESKNLLILNTIIFLAVFIVHLLRLIFQTPIIAGTFSLPMWLSVLALFLSGYLVWQNWTSIPKRSGKTWMALLLGLFVVDLLFVLFYYAYGIEFLGFKGNIYLYAGLFDLIVIGVLWYYLKK